MSVPKYTKEGGCHFDGCKELKRKIKRRFDSDVYCTECGAVYYNLEFEDPNLAGTFKDSYEEVSRENLYKHGFHKKEK